MLLEYFAFFSQREIRNNFVRHKHNLIFINYELQFIIKLYCNSGSTSFPIQPILMDVSLQLLLPVFLISCPDPAAAIL